MTTDEPRGQKTARLTREFRNRIESGTWRDGEALPSSKELASRFGASVYTVTRAIEPLAREGLIENKDRTARIVRSADLNGGRQGPRLSPHVVFIGGYAGSGKTEFGRILTQLTGWMHIDKDTITRPVVEVALETLGQPANDRESDVYLSKIRAREYEALMATAHDNTSCGAGAILTAPFVQEYSDPAWLAREQSRFVEDGAKTTFVWVSCDVESMHTYLRGRGAGRDAWKLANWDTYVETRIDVNFRPVVPHVVVDNSTSAEPLRLQAKRLIQHIAEEE